MKSKVTRRQVFKAGAAAVTGLCALVQRARRAYATSDPAWGCLPADIWPASVDGYKLLELHCFGGMAPYESFYYQDVPGSRTRGFDTEVMNLNWNPVCANTPSGLETHAFSTDSMGKSIHLGPFAKPLWFHPHNRDFAEDRDRAKHRICRPQSRLSIARINPQLHTSGTSRPIFWLGPNRNLFFNSLGTVQ